MSNPIYALAVLGLGISAQSTLNGGVSSEVIVPAITTPTTASNIGDGPVGVFFNKLNADLRFRTLESANNSLTLAYSGDDNEKILLTVDLSSVSGSLSDHLADLGNPHQVTKTQVGLGNVVNLDTTDPVNINQDINYKFVTDIQIDNWNNKQSALGYTAENIANKDIDGTLAANSDIKYASQKATKTYADLKLAKASNLSDLASASSARTNLGLGNVNNTSDASKPISTATQTALDLKQDYFGSGTTAQYLRGDLTYQTLNTNVVTEGTNLYYTDARVATYVSLITGINNGLAPLGSDGKISTSYLPSAILGASIYQDVWNATTNSPTLSDGTGTKGYYYIVTVAGTRNLGSGSIDFNIGDWVIHNGSTYSKVDNTDAVIMVNGQIGNVTLSTSDISEGTNLYYTNARARASIDVGSLPLSYNPSTGVISIASANTSTNGYITSTDWNTFNDKQSTSLLSGKIWVGNSSDSATARTLSGDITISNTGVTAIGSDKVTNAMLAGSITFSKLVGTDITALGTITSGTWNGSVVSEVYGGTNQSFYTLGDMLYSSASNTLSKLSGNTTTTRKFLRQTGNGSISAAPAWDTLTSTDVSLGNVENTTLSTWAGTSNITTLGTITTGVWTGTAITVAKGGTNLTAVGSANQIMGTNNAGTALEYKTLSMGTTAQSNDLGWVLTGANAAVLHVPDATATVRGVITTGSQTMAGAKTWSGAATFNSGASAILIQNNSITTTPVLAFNIYVQNPSTAGTTVKISPRHDFRAAAWNTTGGGSNDYHYLGYELFTASGTTTTARLRYMASSSNNAGTEVASLSDLGRWYLGGATPTFNSLLNLAAGTTTISPINLAPGTNKSTAVAGDFEYDGTNLFFTRSGTTRENTWCGNPGASAPSTSILTAFTNYYGTGGTIALSAPNSWASVNLNNTVYKVPLYT